MASTNRILISVALLVTAVGCASLSETTRTGTIHEVRFGERMVPTNLQVRPGDEVRWINARSTSVTVEFLSGALDSISCERGFSTRRLGNITGTLQESTTIEPNASANLCFENIGTINYNARMESAVAGGQQIERGVIRVIQ